jgi:hypothetical protein
LGGEKTSNCDVVRALLLRLECKTELVVTGNTNDGRVTQRFPSLLQGNIILAKMHTVSLYLGGQRQVVIDEKTNVVTLTKRFDRLRLFALDVRVVLFFPILHHARATLDGLLDFLDQFKGS